MKRFFVSMLMALVLSALSFAQNGRIVIDEWLSQNYTKREVMLKVRDGIHIYTVLYEPNQEYLAKIIADVESGKAKLTSHELLED